jgi:hypothetical protein
MFAPTHVAALGAEGVDLLLISWDDQCGSAKLHTCNATCIGHGGHILRH